MNSVKILIITGTSFLPPSRPSAHHHTVSDSASLGQSQDLSGPEIQKILQHHGYQEISTTLVPDDEARIRQIIRDHSERGLADWIITTGGTGFGVRDKTPEVRSLSPGSAIDIIYLDRRFRL